MDETIAALATPLTVSAIGVIRLSGRDAVAVAGRLFTGFDGAPLECCPARRMCLGKVRDPGDGCALDEALAVVFPGPDSYTGEDVVELHCHGSPPVLREILRLLYAQGAKPAQPGEFTRRAFLNGRMDLAQAEAVIDLISAETADAARNAAAQLDGALGRAIGGVIQSITDICAHFWALVDYPEEDVPHLPDTDIASVIRDGAATLRRLEATYERGKYLREGVPCVLVGKPNTGKSSLLNAMLGYERAIVTRQPGTTRDIIVESLHIGGHWLRLSDTAGLREAAQDEAERLGLARARRAVQDARLLFAVLDGSETPDERDSAVLDLVSGRDAVVLVNKDDLPRRVNLDYLQTRFKHVCPVSALTGKGLDALDGAVQQLLDDGKVRCDGAVLTNLRHAHSVSRAADALASAASALAGGVTADVVLTDLEASLFALGEITGSNLSAEIIDGVFQRFCVGK